MTSTQPPLSKSPLEITRDDVIKLPHFMATLMYVQQTHQLPRYHWDADRIVYHYTDAAGLMGLVESNRLWATDVRFLNDPSEGSYFVSRFFDHCAGLTTASPAKQSAILEMMRHRLDHPREESSTFSTSFCAEGDLLSQWRGYGAFGRGYAVGFQLGMLPHPQIGAHFQVQYGDKLIGPLAEDMLEIFLAAADHWSDSMLPDIAGEAAPVLRHLSTTFKDPSYSDEQESRILVGYTKRDDYLFEREAPLRFRAVAGNIVPYIPLYLDLMEPKDGIKCFLSGES